MKANDLTQEVIGKIIVGAIAYHEVKRRVDAVEKEYDDYNHNYARWLLGMPCLAVHPQTGKIHEVKIECNFEKLQNFLAVCKSSKENHADDTASQEDFDALLLKRMIRSMEDLYA